MQGGRACVPVATIAFGTAWSRRRSRSVLRSKPGSPFYRTSSPPSPCAREVRWTWSVHAGTALPRTLSRWSTTKKGLSWPRFTVQQALHKLVYNGQLHWVFLITEQGQRVLSDACVIRTTMTACQRQTDEVLDLLRLKLFQCCKSCANICSAAGGLTLCLFLAHQCDQLLPYFIWECAYLEMQVL